MAHIIRSIKAALNIGLGYEGSGEGIAWYLYHHI